MQPENSSAKLANDLEGNAGAGQMRVEMNQATVAEYAENLDSLPPCKVIAGDDGHLWLTDGWHTEAAHRLKGKTEIKCVVRPGTWLDAVAEAAGANAKHGLRRTKDDKRRAVEILHEVNEENKSPWSQSDIARIADVDRSTAGKIIREKKKGPTTSGNGIIPYSDSDGSNTQSEESENSDYWLADGFHRWHGARKAELTHVLCDVRQGTLDDAKWFSLGCNKTHGLRRKKDDIQNVIKRALELRPDTPDQAIADHIGVARTTIGNHRRDLESTRQIAKSNERVGSDGRTINTANIGKKPRILCDRCNRIAPGKGIVECIGGKKQACIDSDVLYGMLGLSGTQFNRWWKDNSIGLELDKDFSTQMSKSTGGRRKTVYRLTLGAAQLLAARSTKSPIGRQLQESLACRNPLPDATLRRRDGCGKDRKYAVWRREK
jgi:AntA/AntB antirepressor